MTEHTDLTWKPQVQNLMARFAGRIPGTSVSVYESYLCFEHEDLSISQNSYMKQQVECINMCMCVLCRVFTKHVCVFFLFFCFFFF